MNCKGTTYYDWKWNNIFLYPRSGAWILRKNVAYDETQVFGTDQNWRSHKGWPQVLKLTCFIALQGAYEFSPSMAIRIAWKKKGDIFVVSFSLSKDHKGILDPILLLETLIDSLLQKLPATSIIFILDIQCTTEPRTTTYLQKLITGLQKYTTKSQGQSTSLEISRTK